ncbi:non-ribosomal peptide synthetase [Gordonia araii NBRC 100433]|uniref:Non-ribosomal peptide synthetase n=1 Tax=Gordonia araii NBRC 100433 TaxID=1073574 RepID=G7GX68_9ACTN|nr:hypothetical protein [Gordonia araii]NNG98176.1 peptide synthetase [Gordonia araii NBRC 100433]GAB08193.1 non-ribosomal peptide synthetase [Gordonia araii NBRC 100433]
MTDTREARKELLRRRAAQRRVGTSPSPSGHLTPAEWAPQPDRVGTPAPSGLGIAERRLWRIHQLDPASVSHNITLLLDVEGTTTERLVAGIESVVANAEVLGSVIAVDDAGDPRREPVEVKGRWIEPGGLWALGTGPLGEGISAEQTAAALARTPFDLTREAPLRARVFGSTVVLSFHHLAVDDTSWPLLLGSILAGGWPVGSPGLDTGSRLAARTHSTTQGVRSATDEARSTAHGGRSATDEARSTAHGGRSATDEARSTAHGGRSATDEAHSTTQGVRSATDEARSTTQGVRSATDEAHSTTHGGRSATDEARSTTEGAHAATAARVDLAVEHARATWAADDVRFPLSGELPATSPEQSWLAPLDEAPGRQLRHDLDQADLAAFSAFAPTVGGTPNAALIALAALAVTTLTGAYDHVLLVPADNRQPSQTPDRVGYCGNIVPIRFTFDETGTVGEAMRAGLAAIYASMEYTDVDFGPVLTALRQSGGRFPVVEMMASVRNAPMHGIPVPDGVRVDYRSISTGIAPYPMTLAIELADDEPGPLATAPGARAHLEVDYQLGTGEVIADRAVEVVAALLHRIPTAVDEPLTALVESVATPTGAR